MSCPCEPLLERGGLFADLDVMWLGRPLSIAPSGYLIPVEPHSRSTGKVFGRAERYPTLALFAMPKGTDLASQLDRMFTKRWHTHACEFAKSKDPVPVNESSKKWMANTRDFKDAIKGNPEYMEYRPPISCMPWSINLNLAKFRACVASEDGTPDDQGDNVAIEYKQPSTLCVSRHSSTVNLWHRQWPLQLVMEVADWCQTAKSQVEQQAMASKLPDAIGQLLAAQQPLLLHHFGQASGHAVLAWAFSMLGTGWCQDIIQGGPKTWDPPTAGGCPHTVLGQGPWRGPDIDVGHWTGLLLHVAIEMLVPPFFGKSEGPLPDESHGCPEWLGLMTPQPGPGLVATREFVRRLGPPWPCLKQGTPVEALLPWFMSHYNRAIPRV